MAVRINLSDFVERKHADGDVIIELPDGSEVIIPAPDLWPEAVFEAVDKGDLKAATEAILGADYQRFREAGGNWRMMNAIIKEAQGADAGE